MSSPQRKLTTILSADVEGYSRLMELDEEGTLTALKQARAAMARLIEAHAGRVINTWGDALIAEFASVVEAVRAAIDIQTELAQHNAGRGTDRRMLFRIGINLGDVIVDGSDILGDGVNIAARLQAEAPAGGIVISSTVHDQVRGKMTVGFDFLGNLAVKNISEGVPSYAVRIGDAEPSPARAPLPDRPMPDRSMPLWLARRERSLYAVLLPLGFAAVIVVVVNVFTWSGTFWAKWPLLGIGTAAALAWTKHRLFGARRRS
ncbi:adenylate/guanylate cyclase domain-containing protein [Desertibaculum subflavum]|uniref:adenylate/guanylate cyclase domain-containing protein n=1 Tax=Desertibaculum subflavum TaxID=2268458 RepID=UPI000E65FE4F